MCKLGVISQEQLQIEVKLLLSANRKSYMPRRLAQQRVTLSEFEWPFSFCCNNEASYMVTNIYLVHIKWKRLQNDDTIERIKR